jgi:hypothetical protein
VFVNCPFDQDFLPLLHAILFAIHDCGFIARIAVEDTGSNETRIDKIARIIRESRLSVHDISRVELDAASDLPRFNMPFECGLAMGAIRYGGPLGRDFLFMAAEPYQDKVTLSDLAGQDPKAHGNDPRSAIAAVRSFLSAKKLLGERTRGAEAIWTRYGSFTADLPRLAARLEITLDEMQSFDYLRDWLATMAQWLVRPPRRVKP